MANPALTVPRAADDVGSPQRVLDSLYAGHAITVLRATGGFGKTAAISTWTRNRADDGRIVVRHRVAHDETTGDLFWSALAVRLEDAGLIPRFAPTPRAIVERTVRLAGAGVTLVLDDFDRVLVDGVDEALVELVRDVPRLRVVVCVRGPQHFPRDLWHDLDAVEIGADDLRLTREEVRDAIERVGSPPTERELDEVHRALRGWPGAVAALARRVGTAPGSAIAPMVADVRDDLHRQVVALCAAHVPGNVVLPLAVPETVTSVEIDLLGLPRAAGRRLAALARDGLLVADPATGGYAWPQLVREILLAEFERQHPDELRRAHRRLARHYGAAGATAARAVRHAVASGEWPLALGILERWWAHLVLDGDLDQLRRVLAAAPPEAITSPTVLAAREMSQPSPRYREALMRVALPAARDALQQLARGRDVQQVVDAALVVGIGFRYRDLLEEAIDQFEALTRLLELARGAHTDRVANRLPGVHLQYGVTLLLAGDIIGAVGHLETAYWRGAEAQFDFTRRDAAAKLALAEALRGEAHKARTWLDRAAAAPAGSLRAPWIDTSLAIARVLTDVDSLTPVAFADLPEAGDAPVDEQWMLSIHARSLATLLWGDRIGAFRVIAQARNGAQERAGGGSAFARRLLLTDEIDLLGATGSGSRAAELLETTEEAWPELEVRRARIAAYAQDWPGVVHHAGAALAHESGWPVVDVEALILLATARVHTRDRRAAGTIRLAALRATGSGCIRPFADVTDQDLCALAEDVPEARDLLDSPEVKAAAALLPRSVYMVSLTSRERAVLRRLAAGHTMPEIARAEFVSVNTIKTQVRAIYRKLEVAGRDAAIRRARDHGLL